MQRTHVKADPVEEESLGNQAPDKGFEQDQEIGLQRGSLEKPGLDSAWIGLAG